VGHWVLALISFTLWWEF